MTTCGAPGDALPVKLALPVSDLPLSFELRLSGYRKATRQIVVTGNATIQVPLEKAPAIRQQQQQNKTGPHGPDSALERPE